MKDGNEKLYDAVARSDESAALSGYNGPSLTVQSDAEATDINNIVRAFGIGAKMPDALRMPEYGDYSDIPDDYLKATMFVEDAQEQFMRIPAEVRAHFDNDPGIFMQAALDPNNLEKFRELGLAKPLALDNAPPIVDNKDAGELPK